MKNGYTRWRLGVLGAIIIAALAWGYARWIVPGDEGQQPPVTQSPGYTGITTPQHGDAVPVPVAVEGVVDPADVGDGDLWLVVQAANGRYYPQVTNACRNVIRPPAWVRLVCRYFPGMMSICQEPSSIVIEAGRFDWQMTAALVPDTYHADNFHLVLGVLDPSVSFQIMGVFQVWCQSGIAGLDGSELFGAFRFKELDRVVVTRK